MQPLPVNRLIINKTGATAFWNLWRRLYSETKKGSLLRLPFCFLRAEYEIRTRDPQLGKLMLYQLS